MNFLELRPRIPIVISNERMVSLIEGVDVFVIIGMLIRNHHVLLMLLLLQAIKSIQMAVLVKH